MTNWRYTARGALWAALQVTGIVGAFLLYGWLLTGCDRVVTASEWKRCEAACENYGGLIWTKAQGFGPGERDPIQCTCARGTATNTYVYDVEVKR